METLSDVWNATLGLRSSLSPVYILGTVLIGWLIYLRRRHEGQGFLAWLLPRRIWAHRSTRLDVILYLMTVLLAGLGILGRFAITPVVAAWVAGLMPLPLVSGDGASPILLAFIFWVVGDFALYWVHRIHHQTRALWPLHAVHHSAEVLTPITTYRQHPLGVLVTASIQTAIMGVLLGLIVGVLDPEASLAEIAGVNAFNVVAIMALSNFHHSHVWIRYPKLLERIFISPAMHQIHHSTNPKHFNRNYGGFLSLWDTLFGTLYIPHEEETIALGLTSKDDAPLMTHRLGQILINPLRRIFS